MIVCNITVYGMRTRQTAAREKIWKGLNLNKRTVKSIKMSANTRSNMPSTSENTQVEDNVFTVQNVDNKSVDRSPENRLAMNLGQINETMRSENANQDCETVNMVASASSNLAGQQTSNMATDINTMSILQNMMQFMQAEAQKTKEQAQEIILEINNKIQGTKDELYKAIQDQAVKCEQLAEQTKTELTQALQEVVQETRAEIKAIREENKKLANENKQELYQAIEKQAQKCEDMARENKAQISKEVRKEVDEELQKQREEINSELQKQKEQVEKVANDTQTLKEKVEEDAQIIEQRIGGLQAEMHLVKRSLIACKDARKRDEINKKLANVTNNDVDVTHTRENEAENATTRIGTMTAAADEQVQNNCYRLRRQDNGLDGSANLTRTQTVASTMSPRNVNYEEDNTRRHQYEYNNDYFVRNNEIMRERYDKIRMKIIMSSKPPTFKPDGDVHIVNFLRNIERNFTPEWNDDLRIRYVINNTHWRAQAEFIKFSQQSDTYNEFKELVLNRYWSTDEQSLINQEIHEAPYFQQSKFRSMEEYIKYYWERNELLNAPIDEKTFIDCFRGKLPDWVRPLLIGFHFTTVNQLLDLVRQYDREYARRRSNRQGRNERGNWRNSNDDVRQQTRRRSDSSPDRESNGSYKERNDRRDQNYRRQDTQDRQFNNNKNRNYQENWREGNRRWDKEGAKPKQFHNQNNVRRDNDGERFQRDRHEREERTVYEKPSAENKKVYALQAASEIDEVLKFNERTNSASGGLN